MADMQINVNKDIQAAETILVAETARAQDEVLQAQQTPSPVAIQDEVRTEPHTDVKKMETKKLAPAKTEKISRKEQIKETIFVRKDAEDLADGFNKREGNRQYRLDREKLISVALSLGSDITESSSSEEIIDFIKLRMDYSASQKADPGQIDKTFEFLIESLDKKIAQEPSNRLETIRNKLVEARESYTSANQREISMAQRWIEFTDHVTEVSKIPIPVVLATLRDLIWNPPESVLTIFFLYDSKGSTEAEIKKDILLVLKHIGTQFKHKPIDANDPEVVTEVRTLGRALRVVQAGAALINMVDKKFCPMGNKEVRRTIEDDVRLTASALE